MQRKIKIGRPGYKVTKSRELDSRQRSLLFEVDFPEAAADTQPRHRYSLRDIVTTFIPPSSSFFPCSSHICSVWYYCAGL